MRRTLNLRRKRSAHSQNLARCQDAFGVVGFQRLIDVYCKHQCDCIELLDQNCTCGLLQLLCSLGYPGAKCPKEEQ